MGQIAGNWKMYKLPREAADFCRELAPRVKDATRHVAVAVCPPFTSLRSCVDVLRGLDSHVEVYAQNVHWQGEGAFTGEVSAEMLREIDVDGVIVGHSERRQYFCETDESVAQRAAYATDQELEVIACVGELEEERERGETQEVLRRQVGPIVEAVEAVNRIESLTIAYEPVWAIGTGRTASPEQAQEAHAFIRGLVEKPGGWRINILYGGSVKPDNAAELLSQPDVDGALVGGASLEVESFTAICQAAAGIRL